MLIFSRLRYINFLNRMEAPTSTRKVFMFLYSFFNKTKNSWMISSKDVMFFSKLLKSMEDAQDSMISDLLDVL